MKNLRDIGPGLGLTRLSNSLRSPDHRDMSVRDPNGIQDLFLVITILNIYANPLNDFEAIV